MFQVREAEIDAFPWTGTGETRDFERRIREVYPTVRVRRSCVNRGFSVFAIDGEGGAVCILEPTGLGEPVKSELDRQRRQAMRSRADRLAEREAEEERKEQERYSGDVMDDSMAQAAHKVYEEIKYDPMWHVPLHGRSALDHNVFVRKFDDAGETL